MQRNFVLTLTGPDRIGIVEKVTGLMFKRGGNVETSRMARLGGEFAVLMLVSIPTEQCAGLDQDLEALTAQGYKVTTTTADRSYAETHPGWTAYRIEADGADHEGIIHQIAHYLSELGINIESMDSETFPAPTSGVPLITMTAQVAVPPSLSGQDWEAGLANIGSQMNLEITISQIDDAS